MSLEHINLKKKIDGIDKNIILNFLYASCSIILDQKTMGLDFRNGNDKIQKFKLKGFR